MHVKKKLQNKNWNRNQLTIAQPNPTLIRPGPLRLHIWKRCPSKYPETVSLLKFGKKKKKSVSRNSFLISFLFFTPLSNPPKSFTWTLLLLFLPHSHWNPRISQSKGTVSGSSKVITFEVLSLRKLFPVF